MANFNYTVSNGESCFDQVVGGGPTLYESMAVLSGGTAINTQLKQYGTLIVFEGGSATETLVGYSGSFIVSRGGLGLNTRVSSGGVFTVSAAGTATDTKVEFGGSLCISGGSADTIRVNEGGRLFVYPTGKATKITENGGYVSVADDAQAEFAPHEFSGLTLFSRATVHSGTTATGNSVFSNGRIDIFSGGIANNTMVRNTGVIYVSSGGLAHQTLLGSEGSMTVFSGGSATETTVGADGWLYISSGGKAVSTTVHESCHFQVFDGGTANSTTVNIAGLMTVFSGGTVNNIIIQSGPSSERGGVYIHPDASANNVTVSSGGSLSIAGVASNVTVAENAFLNLTGSVTDLTFASGAKLDIRGAVVNRVAINDGCRLGITNKTTANSATVYSGGTLTAAIGGVVDNTVVSAGGKLDDFMGGIAKNTIVSSGGYLGVSSSTATNTRVNSGGTMWLTLKGIANDTTINDGGQLIVDFDGGTLSNTTVYSGGTALVRGAATVTDFVVNGGELKVYSGDTISKAKQGSGLTVTNRGALVISGAVDDAIISDKAQATVESKGSFTNFTVTSAEVMAKKGATISGVTLSSGGTLNVLDDPNVRPSSPNKTSGMAIKDVTVSSGGVLTGILRDASDIVFDGGTLDLNIAKVSEKDGFIVDYASYEAMSGLSSVTLTVANKQLNGTYKLIRSAIGFNATVSVKCGANYLGTLTVNGGPTEVGNITCDLTQIDGHLEVTVTGGAIPDPICSGDVLIDELLDITSGMSAIDVTVSAGGILNVFSEGVASNTTVYDGGLFNVHSEGGLKGATIYSGGTATIYDDVMASSVIVDGGVFVLESDGWAYRTSKGNTVSSNTIVKNGGSAIVNEGGWLMGAEVLDGGIVEVMSDGTFDIGRVSNGLVSAYDGANVSRMNLEEGGVLKVGSGGSAQHINVSAGGVLTGVLRNASELRIYDGTLDLNIAEAAPGGDVLVDEISFGNITPLQNYTYNCSLTVGSYQADGTYQLIEGAYEFDKTISVQNENGVELGTLTVGQTAEIGGAAYTLNLSDDCHLTVTIEGSAPPPTPTSKPAKFDIDGNGISDVMFVWTGYNYAEGYWMNGTSEWRSTMAIHPAEWETLGCYDMTGDGKADSVLVGNVEIGGNKGAYIGYYADANDTDDNWVNIDYLNNNAGVNWINKIGNLTGGAANSIVWYAPDLYTLGAWTDGTANWVTITGTFGGDWTLVGCGDFDGDGKDSILMTAGGAMYYAADLDGTVKSMGDANWSGWEVRAIGDFKGDGKDDLVLFHQELGSMVMCANGNLDDFESIGQLDAADWFVVGAGDYNGDKKDDLLVRQYSTGMLGYYTGGDVQNGWVELGRGVDMNWTVIA